MISALFLLISSAFAHQGEAIPCEAALTTHRNPPFEIRVSERVPGEAQKYRDYITDITKPDGLLEKLGIRMTGQIIEFLPGRDLNAVTSGSSGGYPVPFFLDGASIMKSLDPRGGYALEVVYPGNHFQHGFYRDDNPERQQKSIIDHVVGHNVFAFSSGLDHYRAGQGMVASQELGQLLTDLYRNHDKDEVQRYYLWALTMSSMLDWNTPIYETPLEFEPKVRVSDYDPLQRRPPAIGRHPARPTENVMAAFAANIAPYQPEWKRRILELLGLTTAFRPALQHTQVLNEGFASIMQEILAMNYEPNKYFEYQVDATKVMQGEDKPDLSNPYSLGVFCWRHLRDKFHRRPEIAKLPLIERDREFLRYGVNEIIAHMVDDEFLRMALDQELIDKHRLAIVRRSTPEEEDPNKPKPKTDKPVAQYTIVSRDVDRVVQSINEMVLKPKYAFQPRVKLVDFRRPSTGEVELVIDDHLGSQWPIRKESVGGSLYALANIIDLPVSLEAKLLDVGVKGNAPDFEADADDDDPWMTWKPRQRKEKAPATLRARIVVSPFGDVKVFRIIEEKKNSQIYALNAAEKDVPAEVLDERLSDEVRGNLKAYLDDLYLDQPEAERELLRHSPELRKQISIQMTSHMDARDLEGVVSHAPGAAGALMEYKRVVERRMIAAMDRAFKAGKGVHVTGSGQTRVKALPSVMHFEFDREYMSYWEKQQPPEPVGKINATYVWENIDTGEPMFGAVFGPQNKIASAVAPIDGKPGDTVWGPGDGGGGGSKPVNPGDNPNDLSWVDIPADLYAKFLGEKVHLPKLNKKAGMSRVIKPKKGKMRNQSYGELRLFETAKNALKRGVERAVEEDRDYMEDIQETYEEGVGLLQDQDIVVWSKKETVAKQTKAVVTFVRDASGSTAGYNDAFKRFVNDMEILIKARYAGTAFEFITFDHAAHLMKNKEEFLRAELGGGTACDAGINLAVDTFKAKYPRGTWDRYTFLLTDLEVDPASTMAAIEDLLKETEFFGTVAGLIRPNTPLLGPMRAETQANDSMGLTVLNPDGTYTIEHLREILKNDPETLH